MIKQKIRYRTDVINKPNSSWFDNMKTWRPSSTFEIIQMFLSQSVNIIKRGANSGNGAPMTPTSSDFHVLYKVWLNTVIFVFAKMTTSSVQVARKLLYSEYSCDFMYSRCAIFFLKLCRFWLLVSARTHSLYATD